MGDKKAKINDKKSEEDFLELTNASAIQECTGLVVEGFGTEEELEKYNEVYNFIQKPIVRKDKD